MNMKGGKGCIVVKLLIIPKNFRPNAYNCLPRDKKCAKFNFAQL